MRTLTQPGPAAAARIVMAGGRLEVMTLTLQPGQTLHAAVTAPLVAAGWQGGTVSITGGACDPFRYVMPGPPDGPEHVAYFTAPVAPQGITVLERANLTFGWADGVPGLHCHAVWTEPDGARRGGHILPRETVLHAPACATAWGCRDIAIRTGFDAETNFPLFAPVPAPLGGATALAARVRPNQDITLALEAVARAAGWCNASVRGSLGSLVGARFADGRVVPDLATEVLVRAASIRNGAAELDLAVIDMAGRVHEGVLARGENAVLITFDLLLTPD